MTWGHINIRTNAEMQSYINKGSARAGREFFLPKKTNTAYATLRQCDSIDPVFVFRNQKNS